MNSTASMDCDPLRDVETDDVAEQLIAACLPAGATCDPAIVALHIREWLSARPTAQPVRSALMGQEFSLVARSGAGYLLERGFTSRGVAFYGPNESSCIVICPDGSRRYCLPLDDPKTPKESSP